MFKKLWIIVLKQLLFLSLILVSLLYSGCACGLWGSPLIDIIIENQTDQVLTIYNGGGGAKLGSISPGEQITIKRGMDIGKYPITAKNVEGEIIFSETYTRFPDDKFHLIEMKEKHKGVVMVYKAVIPPLTEAPENSANNTYSK